jgi:hypothetical protein
MRPASIFLLLLAAGLPLAAQQRAPTGICLVALEPNSPDDEVAGIAHCGYATTCCSYKLITPKGMRFEIPDERFRGMIRLPNLDSLRRLTPEAELARLEAVAERYPLAAPSFSKQLDYLRQLVRNRRGHVTPPPQPATPPIRIAGRSFHDLKVRSIGDGRAILHHRDGVASLPLKSLTEAEIKLLRKLAAKERQATPGR